MIGLKVILLTLQTPGGAGVGRAGRSALVWDHVDVQDEDVRSVLPAVDHRVQISSFLQREEQTGEEGEDSEEGEESREEHSEDN